MLCLKRLSNYQQERSFDTLESAAANEGSGASAFMGAGIGLGAGVGLGTVVGSEFKEISNNINISDSKSGANAEQTVICTECSAVVKKGQKFCHNCGTELSAGFCGECGTALTPGQKFCHNCGAKAEKGTIL